MAAPEEWSENFIDVNGIHLCYHRTGGDKPQLVLLHGITDNGLCWTRVAKDLQNDYDIIMLDARGHGKSTITNLGSTTFSIEDMVDDVGTFIQSLGLDRPILLGHSMGGQVATMVAGKYPHLVSKIALEDPAYFLGKSIMILTPLVKFLFARAIKGMGSKSREEIKAECLKRSPTWIDEDVEPWVTAQQEFSQNAGPQVLRKFSFYVNWAQVFPKITCPVLLIIPSNGILKLKTTKKILPSFQHASIAFIQGAGHNVRREQYDRYMEEVRKFLAPPLGQD
jgi:pimeloyl-ACP methyl ester carboxylesterase